MPDNQPGEWACALQDFASLLDRVERQLDNDRWDTDVPVWQPPPAGLPPPGPAERDRYEALLARAAANRRRIETELSDTAATLANLARRRTAAIRYHA